MWVNTPVKGTGELALINLPEIDRETLGESNVKEREIERHNSHLVMIIWVPAFRKRNLTGALSEGRCEPGGTAFLDGSSLLRNLWDNESQNAWLASS
jgi:hypothetical protein